MPVAFNGGRSVHARVVPRPPRKQTPKQFAQQHISEAVSRPKWHICHAVPDVGGGSGSGGGAGGDGSGKGGGGGGGGGGDNGGESEDEDEPMTAAQVSRRGGRRRGC
jgi:hypothetical protein